MHHAGRMRGIQRGSNLQNDRNRFVDRQLPFFMNDSAKVPPFDELHGDELDSLGLPEIKNANDVAVRDLAREDQLLLESAENFGMAGQLRTD